MSSKDQQPRMPKTMLEAYNAGIAKGREDIWLQLLSTGKFVKLVKLDGSTCLAAKKGYVLTDRGLLERKV